jgi:hypothetical protein
MHAERLAMSPNPTPIKMHAPPFALIPLVVNKFVFLISI